MSNPFIGEILLTAFNFAPIGFAFCNGQILPISQNDALFSLIGTTYGGDGITTFALPDLRGRAPIHFGQGSGLSPYPLGNTVGAETVGVTAGQMPAHSHLLNASAAAGDLSAPTSDSVLGRSALGDRLARSTAPNGSMAAGTIESTGQGIGHENRQPLLALNYIIALDGIYPSRN